jgi:alpha-methylacyl-CoA racemase
VFKTRTRDEWAAIFDGTDACVAPILSLSEAPDHPHNRARGTFTHAVAGQIAPQAAPRLSRTPGSAAAEAPLPGAHTEDVLRAAGLTSEETRALTADGVVG